MSEVVKSLLVAGTLAVLSFSWSVWKAARDVLAERAANWLLPARQPVTFRLGQFLTFLAAVIAPRRTPEWDWDPEDRSFWYLFHPVRWPAFYWPEPDALLAELEFDLKAEQQVLDPVRLAFPVLLEALELRLTYLRKVCACLAWVPFALLLYPLLMLGFVYFALAVERTYTQEQLRRGFGWLVRIVFRR